MLGYEVEGAELLQPWQVVLGAAVDMIREANCRLCDAMRNYDAEAYSQAEILNKYAHRVARKLSMKV